MHLYSLSLESPSSCAARTLTLVAKCLQNLANLVEFGTKVSSASQCLEYLVCFADRAVFDSFVTGIIHDASKSVHFEKQGKNDNFSGRVGGKSKEKTEYEEMLVKQLLSVLLPVFLHILIYGGSFLVLCTVCWVLSCYMPVIEGAVSRNRGSVKRTFVSLCVVSKAFGWQVCQLRGW